MKNFFDISIAQFDQHAEAYANRFNDVSSYKLHFDEFVKYIPDAANILDIACGPGNVTAYLQNKLPNALITGIDLSEQMLHIAKQRNPSARFFKQDARNIIDLQSEYNAIMISFCFPFLSSKDVLKLLNDCYKITSDRTPLYISTMEGDESRAGFEKTSFSADNKVFFNYHKREVLEKQIQENGFEIVYKKVQEYIENDNTITNDLIYVALKK